MLTGGHFENMRQACANEAGVTAVLNDVRTTLSHDSEEAYQAFDLVRMLLQRSPYRCVTAIYIYIYVILH
jgi:hypothetical protein